MSNRNSLTGKLAPLVVRLAALWVLAGAGYKLFSGSPNDLPPVVREFFLGPDLTFRLAIAIELSIAFTALLRPRLGWFLLALQFLVFLAILVQLMLSGEASCGCFGSKVTVSPFTMFSIDAVCLVAMLLTRPWSTTPKREAPWALVAAAAVVAWAAPFLMIQSAPRGMAANVGGATGEWRLPDPLPRYAVLDPDKWVGKHLGDTELAVWLNVDEQILDGTWILYRVACGHCASYFQHLSDTYDPAEGKFYTYVRLSERGEEESREVDPAHLAYGVEVELPTLDWTITSPWRLELEGGLVKEAVFEGDFEKRQ